MYDEVTVRTMIIIFYILLSMRQVASEPLYLMPFLKVLFMRMLWYAVVYCVKRAT